MTDSVRIEVADNGFTLTYTDPEVAERNRIPDRPYEDEQRKRVYNTSEALLADLTKLLPLLQAECCDDESEPDDATEFKRAMAEAFSKE